jgi:hypothetical protein
MTRILGLVGVGLVGLLTLLPGVATAHSSYTGHGCSSTYEPYQRDCFVYEEWTGCHLHYYEHQEYIHEEDKTVVHHTYSKCV